MALAEYRAVRGESLDEDRPYDGLTAKQWEYAHARADGLNASDAYRQAYDCAGSARETVSQRAHELELNGKVSAKIIELVSKRRPQTSLVPRVEVSKDFVVQGIANIAIDTTVKANTRLQAFVHLGKVNGVDAFRDIVVHEKRERTIEEVDRDIARYLSGLIDVTPNPTPQSGNQIPQASDLTPVDIAPGKRDRRRKPA